MIMCIALMRGRKTERKEGWGEREGGGEEREREKRRGGGRKRI